MYTRVVLASKGYGRRSEKTRRERRADKKAPGGPRWIVQVLCGSSLGRRGHGRRLRQIRRASWPIGMSRSSMPRVELRLFRQWFLLALTLVLDWYGLFDHALTVIAIPGQLWQDLERKLGRLTSAYTRAIPNLPEHVEWNVNTSSRMWCYLCLLSASKPVASVVIDMSSFACFVKLSKAQKTIINWASWKTLGDSRRISDTDIKMNDVRWVYANHWRLVSDSSYVDFPFLCFFFSFQCVRASYALAICANKSKHWYKLVRFWGLNATVFKLTNYESYQEILWRVWQLSLHAPLILSSQPDVISRRAKISKPVD